MTAAHGGVPAVKMAAAENQVMNSSEMRSKSANWTLACDVELRRRLEVTAKRFQDKAQSLHAAIEELDSKVVKTSGKLGTNLEILKHVTYC